MTNTISFLVLLFLCGLASSIPNVPPPTIMPEPEFAGDQEGMILDEEPPTVIPMDNVNSMDDEGEAQMSSSITKFKVVTPHKYIYIYGAPYSSRTDGAYRLLDSLENGYPIYEKTDSIGGVWKFYQRSNKYWYLDFNDPDETWSGTVMYSKGPGPSPHLLEYSNQGFVLAFKTIVTRRIPYCNGAYVFEGKVYNNAPVYRGTCTFGSYVFNMYRRRNGKYYVDFNDISEDWAGTIAHTLNSAVVPYDTEWNI